MGGGYLLWISAQHFIGQRRKKPEEPTLIDEDPEAAPAAPLVPGFWATVLRIEVTDIAFAVDSILAAIALVGSAPPGTEGPHPKYWVVITGGMIGVILMRVAAASVSFITCGRGRGFGLAGATGVISVIWSVLAAVQCRIRGC